MIKHKTIFLMVVLFTISVNLFSQKKEIIAKSTIKLEGKNTTIRDLIEIDGYYSKANCKKCNTIAGIMFFDDGIWVDFRFKKDVTEDEIKTNMWKNVASGLDYKRTIRWGENWGIYEIHNDTIIVSIFGYAYIMGDFLVEQRYKVLDRNNIQLVYAKSLLKKDEKNAESPWMEPFNYQFISAYSLPSSDCWIKEQQWTWRNEQDWRDYMERIKQNKIKKK
jgi:hypothetical protein